MTDTIIASLRRLEQAAEDEKVATAELLKAARIAAEGIARTIPEAIWEGPFPGRWRVARLDRLVMGDGVPTLICPWEEGRWVQADEFRTVALTLAGDIAVGWLDELAAWLETRAAESRQAAEVLAEQTTP